MAKWLSNLSKVADLYAPVVRTALLSFLQDYDCKRVESKSSDHSPIAVWSWNDVLLTSDHPLRTEIDSVFPPHPESLFLADCVGSPFGNGRFLDVGTGCGVLALAASKLGWVTTALDINPRALRFARLNAQLAGLEVSLIEGDLLRPLSSGTFSLCIANLPFEPTPGCQNFVHSDGGGDGLKIIARFLNEMGPIIEEEGIVLIPCFSLVYGNETGLERHWRRLDDFDRAILRISPPLDLRLVLRRFPSSVWRRAWRSNYRDESPTFVIEIGVAKKRSAGGSYLGTATLEAADHLWIAPANQRVIAKPRQNSG